MNENEQTNLYLPLFKKPFRVKVQEGWEHFIKNEAKLRKLVDQHADGNAIAEQLDYLLSPVFERSYGEVGFNGEKYDLILNLEGDWSRLFSLTYFQTHAPKEVFEHWNICVGRRSREEKIADYLVNIDGNSVSAKDIQVWTAWTDRDAKVSIYCEKLVPLLQTDEGRAYWFAFIMLDYAIGELAEMKYIRELEILNTPYNEPALTLSDLLHHFVEKLSLDKEKLFDAERYCHLYTGYQMKPIEDATDGLRKDVFGGSSCFIPLLNDFWSNESRIMDTFHSDGIAAGYLCYPLYSFQGEERSSQILDFRDYVTDQLEKQAGPDNFAFIGGATGIYYGYLDFIAWDLKAVLDAAVSIFKQTDMPWAMFHSFRQDVEGVTLYENPEK